MFVDVKRVERYNLSENSVFLFKETVAEELMMKSEDENCCYTADDIPEDIVEKVLAKTVNSAFQEGDEGVIFDDYFMTASLVMGEESIFDAVNEVINLMKKENKI